MQSLKQCIYLSINKFIFLEDLQEGKMRTENSSTISGSSDHIETKIIVLVDLDGYKL